MKNRVQYDIRIQIAKEEFAIKNDTTHVGSAAIYTLQHPNFAGDVNHELVVRVRLYDNPNQILAVADFIAELGYATQADAINCLIEFVALVTQNKHLSIERFK
jgi:hypothetical protein